MTTLHHNRTVVPLLAAALLYLFAQPAAADDVLTPWDVARIRTVTSVVPSPDGSRIAYLLTVPRDPMVEDDGPPWQELHVVEVATGKDATFIRRETLAQPDWTPDGTGISFLAKRDGDKTRGLYVIPVAGGEARRVVSHDSDIRNYDWSPDGRRVAFLATPKEPKEIEELRKKGFSQEVFEEDLRDTQVLIAQAEAHDSEHRVLDLPGSASLALWSPDGRRLAVTLAPTPLVDDDLMQRRVHIVDAESGRVEMNLENPGKLGEVAWGPDSRRIAIVTGEDLHDPAAGRLWVRAVEAGSAWKDVLPSYMGHVGDIAWTGADTIAFVGEEGVETVLGEVRADGTGRRTRVAAGGQVFTAVSAAKSGLLALAAESPRHPAEAFALAADAAAPKRLTNSNTWLDGMRLAPHEVITHKARDGQELQGILIRPLDGGRERAPLIVYVHGGPESRVSNGWLTGYATPGQVAAARGFAVFYPNYRGSTGRGVAFSKLSQGDPAGKEFDDLVDAVDHLVSIGVADKAKVGITGGSYGGYATGWASTYYSERFAAGVMFVGISDKISKVGTTDIANEEYLVHARKRPWEAWQFFLERSPIYHAAKSRTPLLILHGKDDPRVHPTQSLELYRHLKLHGNAPVRLVWYPGEQHGNRRAASRLDYNLRMLRWFEHYLKGPGKEPPSTEIEYQEEKDGAQTTAEREQ